MLYPQVIKPALGIALCHPIYQQLPVLLTLLVYLLLLAMHLRALEMSQDGMFAITQQLVQLMHQSLLLFTVVIIPL